jgi:hypothetical protein
MLRVRGDDGALGAGLDLGLGAALGARQLVLVALRLLGEFGLFQLNLAAAS